VLISAEIFNFCSDAGIDNYVSERPIKVYPLIQSKMIQTRLQRSKDDNPISRSTFLSIMDIHFAIIRCHFAAPDICLSDN
jgi:hypothetical protein